MLKNKSLSKASNNGNTNRFNNNEQANNTIKNDHNNIVDSFIHYFNMLGFIIPYKNDSFYKIANNKFKEFIENNYNLKKDSKRNNTSNTGNIENAYLDYIKHRLSSLDTQYHNYPYILFEYFISLNKQEIFDLCSHLIRIFISTYDHDDVKISNSKRVYKDHNDNDVGAIKDNNNLNNNSDIRLNKSRIKEEKNEIDNTIRNNDKNMNTAHVTFNVIKNKGIKDINFEENISNSINNNITNIQVKSLNNSFYSKDTDINNKKNISDNKNTSIKNNTDSIANNNYIDKKHNKNRSLYSLQSLYDLTIKDICKPKLDRKNETSDNNMKDSNFSNIINPLSSFMNRLESVI